MPKLNKAMNQILSGNEAKLEVDLDEMFGTIVPDSSAFRQTVGQAIIDKIRERTADGIGAKNENFKNYSEVYAESDEFKAYGKSKSEPNLKQTGDMLGLMDVVEEGKNKIVIGWEDKLQAEKAHGHVTGNVGVKRNFLGLPIDELEKIASKFQDELPKGDLERPDTVGAISDFLNSSTNRGATTSLGAILKVLNLDDES